MCEVAECHPVMDTPSRARLTDLAAAGESSAAIARRLSADAVSSLSLEGSVSSSGSAGQPDSISGRQGFAATEASPSGLSDAGASSYHQTECEFRYISTLSVHSSIIICLN